ncbi:inactive dipeptidyl peptidase 10 isoform X1 [Schistocerca cancellata]|uniref:inactive dipeptidyl peptidase 10 isoform X1 n=1 Tax=Schistocerca cancellata TaxID=274614 RepID=UPI00211830C2|nr:inactive dipeptidyl peptidase 10 isoform X1 [Schistocerca cancellata]XP_049787850.1 inactive dipeptidyl peptidase 10 isoform X1 [Schistocerca cancellata]
MHTNVNVERNSWRLPPDETVQVADPRSKSVEDLVYPTVGDGHNWRSIVLSLVVIGLVIAGIVTAIYLLGYVDELLYWSGQRMKLEEFLEGDLTPERLPPAWVTRTQFVYQADDGSLAVLDTSNDSISLLVTNHTLRQLDVKGYECSTDLRFVLFRHNVKWVFRQSFTAHYTIYDVSNDHHIPVRLSDKPKVQQTRLQRATWLGNSTALLLVADNDLYLRPAPISDLDVRLTDTGQPGVFYNGVPDWLYQEDVLTTPEALWGSADGSHVLFATFNDSEVRSLAFPWFGAGASSGAISGGFGTWSTFPESRSVRFPTPGTTNPDVRLWILDLSNYSEPIRWEIRPPSVLEETVQRTAEGACCSREFYLTSAGWVGDDNHEVSAVWLNRAQNISIISTCHAPNWTCVETHAERAAEESWLEVQPHPVFSPDGGSFLLLAPVKETSTHSYTHIKHITITEQRIAVLSHGNYEVMRILAWDNDNHLVYYLGTHDSRPGQQHLYVVPDPSTDDPRRLEPQCVTCDPSGPLWSSRYWYANCSHFSAAFAPGGHGQRFYVLQCEGPGLPLAGVHDAVTHRLQRVLFDTRPWRTRRLDELALPQRQSFEVPLQQGYRAHVQLLLPPSWRAELRDAAFPVLVEVNGRPGSLAVSERFAIDWGTYMSSRNDVVYVKLDVRGSRGQGSRALFRRLGGVEVQDQIAVLRYLLDELKFLDETRVGVWGWGYGGYVTAMLMGSQQSIFKCGIAVSPIADWLYYNSAFTERVLGLPGDNYKGYVEADATQRARYVPSHSLYLLHGLADVTAPYVHGVALARALAQANIIFRYQSYADEGHLLQGVLEHVYRSMEDFLKECLKLDVEQS